MLRAGEKVYTPLLWTDEAHFERLAVTEENKDGSISGELREKILNAKTPDAKYKITPQKIKYMNFPYEGLVITSTIIEALYDFRQERITKYEHDMAPEIVARAQLKLVMENETSRASRYYTKEEAQAKADMLFKNAKSSWNYRHRELEKDGWKQVEVKV